MNLDGDVDRTDPRSSLAAATSDLVGIPANDIADPFFGIMAAAIQSEIGGPGDVRRRTARGRAQAPAAPRSVS